MKKSIVTHDMFQDKICENTYEALKALIENSYYSQLTLPHPILDMQSNWKEYCTVKLCTSRRGGHSTAICRVAHEYFSKALILSPKEDMSVRLREMFPDLIISYTTKDMEVNRKHVTPHLIRVDESEYHFYSTNNMGDIMGNLEFEAVFVDCACMLSKEKVNKIYNFGHSMMSHPQKYFIFIQ